MKKQSLIILIIAVLIASLAVWFAKRWVSQSTPTANAQSVKIIVAREDIPFAVKIGESQLKLADWPKNNLPKSYLTDVKAAINKVTTRVIVAGEFVNNSNIREHLGGSPLSALIEPNMRAVTVRVNDVVGVSAFILPGNFVDVLATPKLRYRATNDKASLNRMPTTYVAVQNVKVLAVDQDAGADKNKPAIHKSVTLEVSAEQATKLVFATTEGTIQLMLRNPLDKQNTPEPLPEPIPPEPEAEPKPVEVKAAPVVQAPPLPAPPPPPLPRNPGLWSG